EYMPVGEDGRGTYIFNPKELALFDYISPLKELGVDSFKIEGRMKSIHYVASVVSLYRRLLDGENIPREEIETLLNRVKNRGYSTGFMKGGVTPDDYQINGDGSNSEAEFVANITEERENGCCVAEVRNHMEGGETVEILEPSGHTRTYKLPEILTFTDGTQAKAANHSKFVLLEGDFIPYSILRRVEG
ncbi:U32 family peptidase C-terminal domain-containing protein, partial [bacterium]|nr:U32 family peptidase C-terminal domain-containing protein [bacterium]